MVERIDFERVVKLLDELGWFKKKPELAINTVVLTYLPDRKEMVTGHVFHVFEDGEVHITGLREFPQGWRHAYGSSSIISVRREDLWEWKS